MRHYLSTVTLAFICVASANVYAKDHFDTHKPLIEPELHKSEKSASFKSAALTVDEVGDVDSFGRNVKWAGLGQTKSILVDSACVPDAYTACSMPSSGGAMQWFDARDLDSIVLPKKTAHSLVCHHITPFYNYFMRNDTGSLTNNARVSFTPYVTIYNPVLSDPAAIDPNTGLPYGGQIESGMAMSVIRLISLAPGAMENQRENFSRHCIAGLISKKYLVDVWGLPAALADQFFKHETKIVFHLRGSHNFVDSGSFFYGIRLTVD